MSRLLDRLRRRPREPEPPAYADDGTLTVVITAPDPARADSAVLAEAAARGVDLEAPLLVRHHLLLPSPAAVEAAAGLLAQDGYAVVTAPAGDRASGPGVDRGAGPAGDLVAVRASRTQRLTAMSAAQERSRMAGLAQRLGGDVRGWDALAPAWIPAAADDHDGRRR